MTDNATDAGSTAAAPPVALKSNDTSTKAIVPATVPALSPERSSEVTTEPKPQAAKAESATPPEGVNAPTAESPEKGKEQRLPRWMKERLERERQVTAARTRAEVLKEFQSNQPDPPKQEKAAGRTLEDFDFDLNAFTTYQVDQRISERDQQQRDNEGKRKQADAAEQFKSRIDAFETRVGAGAWEDIESSKLNSDPEYKPLVDMFLGDDQDLDIAHHLARNLEEADRLLSLSPMQRGRELAKLADQFSSESAPAASHAPPKKTTNAPPPPKTVSGAGKPSVDINSPELSTSARIALWKR